MAGLHRRDFLKALGLAGTTSAASACGLDNNYYRTPIEKILPYTARPDQMIPGNPVFFASTVTTGPSAFSTLARHREGRVLNIGANFKAPFAPAVPREAFLELQRAYSPDRRKAPSVDGKDLSWDDAKKTFADAAKAARAAGKRVVWLGGYVGKTFVDLAGQVFDDAIYWEPLGRDAEAAAAEQLFGARMLPAYDLSTAHYVLSFGADFLGTWGGTVAASQYAAARDPNQGGFVARMAWVNAHRGQSGANADDWFAATPGSEALVALAIAKLVAEKKSVGGRVAELVAGGDVAAAAAASGLTAEDITAIAEQFAGATAAVALPGGVVGASKVGTDLAAAVFLLNLAAGMGGVTFGAGRHYSGPVHGYASLERLVGEMKDRSIGVLVLGDHTNPAYTAPNSGFAEALANVDLVVATSSHPDESSSAAKVLVLPCASTLEDWGDEEPQEGLHLVRQPGMLPLGNLPGVGDLLLALGRDGGGKPASVAVDGAIAAPTAAIGFGPGTFREYLAARWKRDVFPAAAPAGGDFDAFWAQSVGDGFVDVRVALRAPDVTGTYTFAGAGAFDGSGDLYLLAYPHPFRGDGRYANQPWAQEVPDPMSGVVWDSWVEMHPETAARLGIADGDLVEITTASGKIEVGAELTPAVRKDVLAVAFGQGHISGGRYANNVGANVAALVAAGGAGAAAWQSAKAAARATGAKAGKVSTFGADYDFGRDIGVVVDAAELAKVGDAPAEHPGALTAIHLLELDERLQAAGVESMYEGPEHPTYKFGMTVDVNACNGCGACAIACYAENNLAVVGKYKVAQGREMGWIRIGRYYGDDETSGVKDIRFVPMMCQHCSRAPCESVCPVLATYHTIDGLNAMIYNRCVGTRYCSNNCPYKARRFNYHSYTWPEPFNLQLNPDVTTRTMGVMEKCTFCIQRIRAVKSAYRNEAFTATVPDAALRQLPACVEACPAQALQFGNLNDAASVPSTTRKSARTYQLFAELNTEAAVNYLGRATFHPVAKHHGEGAYGEAAHGAAEGHAEPPQGAAPHGEAAGHAEPAAPATH